MTFHLNQSSLYEAKSLHIVQNQGGGDPILLLHGLPENAYFYLIRSTNMKNQCKSLFIEGIEQDIWIIILKMGSPNHSPLDII